jgi:hypothetical protein
VYIGQPDAEDFLGVLAGVGAGDQQGEDPQLLGRDAALPPRRLLLVFADEFSRIGGDVAGHGPDQAAHLAD